MHTIALALAMVALPLSPVLAQAGDAPQGRQMGPSSRIPALLANADELGLSDIQRTQLEAIQAQLEEQNAPLLEQIGGTRVLRPGDRSAGPPTPEERENLQARRAEIDPVMRELRENSLAAMEQARAVLTAEQREQARELLAARGPGGNRMSRPGPGRTRP